MTTYVLRFTMRDTRAQHSMSWMLDPDAMGFADELRRIKAVAQALFVSPEFEEVQLLRQVEMEEEVDIGQIMVRPGDSHFMPGHDT